MQWRLILEEYSPELIYIQGSKNVAANVLSRLDIVDTPNPVKNIIKSVNEHYGLEDEDILHHTNYKIIMQNQQKNRVVEWSHNALCHPGKTRTELSIF